MIRASFPVFCGLLLLLGCGNDPSPGNTTVGQVRLAFDQIKRAPSGPTAEQIRANVTPHLRAQFGGAPLKVATLEKPTLSSLLIGVGQNGDVSTFTTPDGVSFAFESGMLVATRGLGADLMTADVGQSLHALSAGGGAGVVRIHRYLDGDEQIMIRSFVCDIRRDAGGIWRERCSGPLLEFENTYQIAADGTLVGSRQWISPLRGYLTVADMDK